MNMDEYEKLLLLRLLDAAQDLKLFIDAQPPGTPLLISGKNVRDSRAYELAGQAIADAKTYLTSKQFTPRNVSTAVKFRRRRTAEKRILPLRRNQSGVLYIETSGPCFPGKS